MHTKVEREIAGRTIRIESGKVAKQAAGSVMVYCGDTVLLCVTTYGEAREGTDFFPLTCEYREKAYAAGKIPGGFPRREGRMSTRETLISRLMDRPIRPNFPDGFIKDVRVECQVLSYDPNIDPDILAMIGASASINVSPLPFSAPLGAVRLGRVNGELIVNPDQAQREVSTLDLIISGTKDAIMMVEGEASELPEEVMLEALHLGHKVIGEISDLIDEVRKVAGKEKIVFEAPCVSNPFIEKLKCEAAGLTLAFRTKEKLDRYKTVSEFKASLAEKYLSDVSDAEKSSAKALFSEAFDELKTQAMRDLVFSGTRCDGRGFEDIRTITSEINFLPRAHGSALFTRGETQSIVTCTLGTSKDSLLIDDLNPKRFESFMLHYNFPKFSVGEVGGSPGPGRREIGHGTLAQRALKAVLPSQAEFPYTIRIVSDITESNGSSSMASVCGGSMSLMNAGVPVKAPVAGIAMGLFKDGNREAIVSDILGDEDHYGDMDFKVAGTEKGITALQMDIKIDGLSPETFEKAMMQAKRGRAHILGEMAKTICATNSDMSDHAPRLSTIKVSTDLIGKVIGPGGKMIREIQETSGADLDIADDGTITIFAKSKEATDKAFDMINSLSYVPKEGDSFLGDVKSVREFGAFIEIRGGVQGLLHVSELSDEYVRDITGLVNVGDKIQVVIAAIDKAGKIRFVKEANYKKD